MSDNKIYFTYGTETQEGSVTMVPLTTAHLPDESVDIIEGAGVIEKVKDLPKFIEECYRLLKVGGTAKFSSPHYASNNAWTSPLTLRGISESSLNFSSKEWRTQYKFTEIPMICDFEVVGSFSVEAECTQRSDIARNFWMHRYNNVVQAVIFTLTKKAMCLEVPKS